MKQLGSVDAGDNLLGLAWSGDRLAAAPATGEILILDASNRSVSRIAGHGSGNGQPAWFLGSLATCGFDGKVRWAGRELHSGRGIIERVRVSPDGTSLAAAQGKALLVFGENGEPTDGLVGLPAAIADFAWCPTDPQKVAVVGAGGARMWRLGAGEPFARFDWGGASLGALWSPCGRWLATADQTPSVHLYDFTRDHPLHIQGFETKVRALAFSPEGKSLAAGGGPVVTVWPCAGECGPEGATPLQLEGHDEEVVAAAFSPANGQLATGDLAGALCLFSFQGEQATRKRLRLDAGISALAWHPEKLWLAVGREDGAATILSLDP